MADWSQLDIRYKLSFPDRGELTDSGQNIPYIGFSCYTALHLHLNTTPTTLPQSPLEIENCHWQHPDRRSLGVGGWILATFSIQSFNALSRIDASRRNGMIPTWIIPSSDNRGDEYPAVTTIFLKKSPLRLKGSSS